MAGQILVRSRLHNDPATCQRKHGGFSSVSAVWHCPQVINPQEKH
ncbi:MAG: hypothetical protein AAFZ80_10410 [Cyanobacteria bacterium P01_A01_bin.105]